MHYSGRIACSVVFGLNLLAGVAQAQPVITLITNAASHLLPPVPGSSLAQGSFFEILGSGALSSPKLAAWATYPLPTTLAGISVELTVAGTTTNALIFYAGSQPEVMQIDAVVPSATPTGAGTVVVTQNGRVSAAFPITIVAASPGAFSYNASGAGPGAFFNASADGSLTRNTVFNSAIPGQTVTLYGTGLGPAADPAQEGQHAPTQRDVRNGNFSVDIWVGNRKATVQYAGRSSFTAEDQFNFVVPADVSGCYNDVIVEAGQTVSNFTSLAVSASGGACADADGIDMADLQEEVSSKGSANVGAIALLSDYLNLAIPELGNLQWDSDTVTGEIGAFTAGVLDQFQGFTSAPSVNNCAAIQFFQYPPPVDPALSQVAYLDAGASLSIQGPNGAQPVPKNTNGDGYAGLVGGETISELISGCPGSSNNNCAPFFLNATGWGTQSWSYAVLPGTYTVTGPGGSQVGALSASLAVSSAAASFTWTNQISVTANPIPRDSPLTITWTGGDPSGFVDITAVASTVESGITPTLTTPGIVVECIAPASAGTFTIPVQVLQALPSTASSTALLPPGELLVGPASGAVKVTAPAGLDAAYIYYHYIQGANVVWQ
jgi:uncharacterized protein (TIGR03437 family)